MRVLSGAIVALVLGAVQARAITPDSVPSEGRSLFDHLIIVKGSDGTFRYDFPTNFKALAEVLIQRSGGVLPAGTSPLGLLFPAGRSLQRADGDLKDPRRVLAFTVHHSPVHELGISLRDRIFLGHSPRKKQLEVISYNELAGRFEFQLVTDYGEGLTPKVRYADRPTCTRCHRAEAPIFPPRDWDESNANPIAAAGIAWANGLTSTRSDGAIIPNPDATLDGGLIRISREADAAWEVNRSVLRADEWQFVQTVWQKGCRVQNPLSDVPNYTASDCRAQLVILALANKLGISFVSLLLPPTVSDTAFLPPNRLKSLVASNFSNDLRFLIYNIPARNIYKDFRLPMKGPDFLQLDQLVKADAAIGDHIPDPSIAPDAPDRVADDDLAKDSDRVVSAIRRLWSNIKDMHAPEQWALIVAKIPPATDPGAGKTLIDLFLKMRKSEAFADRPIRRGVLLSAIMEGLGAKPPNAKVSCCASTDGFPPMLFTDDSVIPAGLTVERQILRNRCAACHKGETSLIGFLANESMLSDRELVMQMLARELKLAASGGAVHFEFCRRVNWTLPLAELPMTARMPQSPAIRKDMLNKERGNPPYIERKILIDAAKRAMGKIAGDDAWANDLRAALVKFNNPLKTVSVSNLKSLMTTVANSDCQYAPFDGETP